MRHSRTGRGPVLAALAAALTAALALSGAGPAAAVAPLNVADDLPNLSTPVLVYGFTGSTGNFAPAGPVVAVVARGADSSLLFSRRSATGDTYGPMLSLGCATAACGIAGDPAALQTQAGNIEIFVRGTNDLIYTNTVTPANNVVGFGVLSGLLASSEPEVVQIPGEPLGNIRVFARGHDGAVWSNIRRAGTWQGWVSLGGFITSEIGAGRGGLLSTQIQLVARGGDKRVYRATITGDTTTWQPLGDFRATSNVTFAGNQVVFSLYARGEDGRAWTINPFAGQTQWTPIGDLTITSDIATVFRGGILVRGTDNAIYYNVTTQPVVGAPWVGYTRLGGVVTGNPAAYSPANNEQTSNNPIPNRTLLVRDSSGQLARNAQPFAGPDTAPFTGYTSIGGSILGLG